MQVVSSPRRFLIAGVAVVMAALIAVVTWWAIVSGKMAAMLAAGPICIAFLAVVVVRALRTRVEWDADGGRYHGLVRTRAWSWSEVRFVGRQSTYAFGSTGSTPELTLRGGRHLVLVGLSDPGHPDAEDAAIGRLRAAADAYKATHPSAAEQLVAMLTDEPAPAASDQEKTD